MKSSNGSLFWGTAVVVSTVLALFLPMFSVWGIPAAAGGAAILVAIGFLSQRAKTRREASLEPVPNVETVPGPVPDVEPGPAPREQESPDLALRIGVLHYVSQRLHEASIGHIRAILTPLATSLFGVKANLQGLLNKSNELEHSFRNDSQGLGQTVNRFSAQSSNIRQYAHDLDTSVKKFSSSGTEMAAELNAIAEASRQINDVAERIKVLSINASIEAARAGNHGAGFKIISQEVRKLAEDTNSLSSQIEDTIAEAIRRTKAVFDQFTTQYFQRAEEMHVIQSTTEELETFVKGLFAMIDGIFKEYDSFVVHLESELDNVSPGLQKNEIATQQIENTWRGLQENLRSVFPGLGEETSPQVEAEELRPILETFAKYLTTPLEAEVLRRIGDAAGLTLDSARKETGDDITLF